MRRPDGDTAVADFAFNSWGERYLPYDEDARIGEAPPLSLPALTERQRPLEGVRVLDLTRILAGPVGGRALAAYGADVMLVNAPHLPNIEAIADTSRGKRSVHVDLGAAEGRDTMDMLLQGAHVFVQNRALRRGSPKDIAKLVRGEPVDPAAIYFRCAPTFEVSHPALAWMTESLFIGTGARFPDRVEMRFFRVA